MQEDFKVLPLNHDTSTVDQEKMCEYAQLGYIHIRHLMFDDNNWCDVLIFTKEPNTNPNWVLEELVSGHPDLQLQD